MARKLQVNNFEWIEETPQFNEDFIKNFSKESDGGYILEFDVQYQKKLHELHNDLPFSSEWMAFEKVEKLIANLCNKTGYVIRTKKLKQALNHALILKKVHRVIKFNQKDCFKIWYWNE